MEVYTSDSNSDSDSREQKTLDYGHLNLSSGHADDDMLAMSKTHKKPDDIYTVLLNHNRLSTVPKALNEFINLKVLDLSSNCLLSLPDALCELPLVTLIAKNNQLTNKTLPKSLLTKGGMLKELNLSGNSLKYFPDQALDLKMLKYLKLGGNQIVNISKDVWKMKSLQILSMGGNQITEVPETVGNLHQLQALDLCDNLIEVLPTSIARLKNLKLLQLHKNRLRHLPRDIITLRNLTELSLRDNPLVVRFVQDMTLNPPTLMELAARIVKMGPMEYGPMDLPRTVLDYLKCANCCVNPQCKGVFFDNRVEHIKFVDFCGKYRVPLLEYLCSSKCVESRNQQKNGAGCGSNGSNSSNNLNSQSEPGASGYMMRKVLLG